MFGALRLLKGSSRDSVNFSKYGKKYAVETLSNVEFQAIVELWVEAGGLQAAGLQRVCPQDEK